MDAYHMALLNLVFSVLLFSGIFLYTFVFPKKQINIFFLLILFSLLPLISIFRIGVYESGDFSIHTKFAMQFFQNLKEGNLFPRWVPNHCGGYGCPVFMFLYPLPYYIISFFHFLGFSFIGSMKLFLSASFVLSGIGMYLFIKKEIDKKTGFIAGIFYLFAPYHLIDLHFRSSVGELMSISLLPFIFYFTKCFLDSKRYIFFVLTSVLLFLIILSHQATTVLSLPLLIMYAFYVWKSKKSRKVRDIIIYVFSLLLGVLISTYYWLPLLIEDKYIQFVRRNVFEFNPLQNFFIPPGRFFVLFQGMYGELYFTIGYTQILVLIIALFLLITKGVTRKLRLPLLVCISTSVILFILMQEISLTFWQNTPFLKHFIYTWRLFIPLIFLISIISAIVVKTINRNIFLISLCIVTIMYTLLNWSNRRMLPEVTDEILRKEVIFKEKTGELEITTPVWVDDKKAWVGTKAKAPIEVTLGNAQIVKLSRSSTSHEYVVKALSQSTIKENTYYFPGWKVLIDNKEFPIIYNDLNYPGVIHFKLSKGLHYIKIFYTDTPVHLYGKLISLCALLLLILTGFLLNIIFRPATKKDI